MDVPLNTNDLRLDKFMSKGVSIIWIYIKPMFLTLENQRLEYFSIHHHIKDCLHYAMGAQPDPKPLPPTILLISSLDNFLS